MSTQKYCHSLSDCPLTIEENSASKNWIQKETDAVKMSTTMKYLTCSDSPWPRSTTRWRSVCISGRVNFCEFKQKTWALFPRRAKWCVRRLHCVVHRTCVYCKLVNNEQLGYSNFSLRQVQIGIGLTIFLQVQVLHSILRPPVNPYFTSLKSLFHVRLDLILQNIVKEMFEMRT